MKLTAQLAPVVVTGAPAVLLEIDSGSGWQPAATAAIDADAYTASFRVPNWSYSAPIPFRVGFAEGGATTYRTGIIQADPVDKPELVVAAMSCMVACAADAANDGFNGVDEAASTRAGRSPSANPTTMDVLQPDSCRSSIPAAQTIRWSAFMINPPASWSMATASMAAASARRSMRQGITIGSM